MQSYSEVLSGRTLICKFWVDITIIQPHTIPHPSPQASVAQNTWEYFQRQWVIRWCILEDPSRALSHLSSISIFSKMYRIYWPQSLFTVTIQKSVLFHKILPTVGLRQQIWITQLFISSVKLESTLNAKYMCVQRILSGQFLLKQK